MANGGSSFSSQQTENSSSDLNSSGTRNQAEGVQPNPQEVVVPIENVNRIMRSVLPSDVQIEEDSMEVMAEFASAFMSHMIEEASRRCQQERREVVTGDDIIDAMTRFELERQAAEAIYIANAAHAIVPQQDPRNHEPMAPATPPHVAAYRAPMVGDLSGDEGSDGSDDETSNESFIHVENLNRRSNFSG